MNNGILQAFIEAEKSGVEKIREVYDRFFSMYENDYKKMAELMMVVKNRLDVNIDDKKLGMLYVELRATITGWSEDSLSEDEYYKFCDITDNQCIERIEKKK